MRCVPVLCLLLACSRASEQEVLLADYDFFRLPVHPIYGAQLGADIGLHAFGPQWATPKGNGLHASEAAEIRLHCLGRDGLLRLRYRGQGRLLWDDLPLVEFASSGWDTLRVALPAQQFGEGPHRLEVEAQDFALASLQLRARLDTAQQERWRSLIESPPADPRWRHDVAPPAPPVREHPDILMLVLDSLRADHVGAYGYARATTPQIDALAAGGLRFTQVFADAPYTLCSVSSYFTGRSWQEHRVIEREDRLPDGMPTLAQLLKAAGYQTRAISDNPNVSIARAHDRGFDEFRESWRQTPIGQWDPEVVEREFTQSLGDRPGEAPLFYYLHLMPPHAPYYPDAAHDLFGDPAYGGTITGSVAQINQFDRGEGGFDAADRERLIALYDGGIRRGDAMLGRLRERWLALGRTRPLLTIVLSDHGEAFGEHGRYSHNTSVHDEMLHVPLIFHPRELAEPLAAGAERFHALSELTPMLLALLGVPLSDGPWPLSFLRNYADPTLERDALFVRANPHLFGLRKPDSLLLLRLWGEQQYFDLRADPRATNDLRSERSELYLSDLRELRAFLEHPIGALDAGEIELSEEERERLRALGYF